MTSQGERPTVFKPEFLCDTGEGDTQIMWRVVIDERQLTIYVNRNCLVNKDSYKSGNPSSYDHHNASFASDKTKKQALPNELLRSEMRRNISWTLRNYAIIVNVCIWGWHLFCLIQRFIERGI